MPQLLPPSLMSLFGGPAHGHGPVPVVVPVVVPVPVPVVVSKPVSVSDAFGDMSEDPLSDAPLPALQTQTLPPLQTASVIPSSTGHIQPQQQPQPPQGTNSFGQTSFDSTPPNFSAVTTHSPPVVSSTVPVPVAVQRAPPSLSHTSQTGVGSNDHNNVCVAIYIYLSQTILHQYLLLVSRAILSMPRMGF